MELNIVIDVLIKVIILILLSNIQLLHESISIIFRMNFLLNHKTNVIKRIWNKYNISWQHYFILSFLSLKFCFMLDDINFSFVNELTF